jgi:hypothetical protein
MNNDYQRELFERDYHEDQLAKYEMRIEREEMEEMDWDFWRDQQVGFDQLAQELLEKNFVHIINASKNKDTNQ